LTNSPTTSFLSFSVTTLAFWVLYAAPAASPTLMPPPLPTVPPPEDPAPPTAPLAMSPPDGFDTALSRFCCCSMAMRHDAIPGAACEDFQAQ